LKVQTPLVTPFVTRPLVLQVFDEYDEEVQAAEEAELSHMFAALFSNFKPLL
jgi:hypothetical protein